MALTDLAVRQAKATGMEYTLGDGDGLALRVTATGAKYWHFRYFWLGKQKRMSFGTYPEVSLRDARDLRHEARALLAKNINPHHDRKRKRLAARLSAENTLEAVYQKWLAHRSQALGERRHGTLAQIRRVFANDVLPFLQAFTVTEITRAHLLDVVGRIDARNSLSIAQKVRQLIVTILGQLDKVDAWRVYYSLSRPHHQLGSRVPIEAVTPTSLRKVIHAVQSSLDAEKSA
jgi:hypothetical protein